MLHPATSELPTGERTPVVQLRPYQEDALGALKQHRDAGNRRGLLSMATGLGKTVVGALDVDAFIDDKPDAKILFLTHRNEIINQSRERFSLILGHRALQYHFLQSQHVPEDLLEKSFVFASFQMMHSGRYRGDDIRDVFDRTHFDYVLTDEAHHAAAPTYLPTLRYFDARYSLGLTATPDRADRRDIRLFFGREVFKKSLAEGVAEGYLARPHYVGIAPKATIEAVESEHEDQFAESAFDRATAEEVVRDILERTAHIENPKILVYTRTIEEAELYAQLLPNARAIHSALNQDDRTALLDDFRVTRPATLTSIDVLNEGIDIPDVDVIVMARSTGSEAVFLQQIGRGLRKSEGKSEVLILDYVANSARLQMVARLIGDFPVKEGDEEEKPTKKRRSTVTAEKTIDAPLLELENATFEFDASVLDIIAILKERQERHEKLMKQTPEKSAAEYRALCEQHKTLISYSHLVTLLGVEQAELILFPFDGRMTSLREAMGVPRLENYPNMISISRAAQETGIYYIKFEDALHTLGVPITELLANNGRLAKCIDRTYMMDVLGYVRPVGGRYTQFIIPEGHVATTEAHLQIAPNMPFQAFRGTVAELGIPLHRQYVLGRFKSTIEAAELEAIKQHIEALPYAKANMKTVEEVAAEFDITLSKLYRIIKDDGVGGTHLRSPETHIAHTYLTPKEAAYLRACIIYSEPRLR